VFAKLGDAEPRHLDDARRVDRLTDRDQRDVIRIATTSLRRPRDGLEDARDAVGKARLNGGSGVLHLVLRPRREDRREATGRCALSTVREEFVGTTRRAMVG